MGSLVAVRTRIERLGAALAEDPLLLAEAALALLCSQIALRCVGLARSVAFSRRLLATASPCGAGPCSGPARRAVDRIANALGATCLPRSLALQWLLARRGIPSVLQIGVPVQGALWPAHAWVEVVGETDEMAAAFVGIASLPAA